MKKRLLVMGMAAILCAGPINTFTAMAESTSIMNKDWEKDKDGAWPGLNGASYKIDKMGKLSWSKDGGKKWSVEEQMWQDESGKWLKINNKMLVWSEDGGASWVEVPEWKWRAADGKWYKFDKSWTLWVKD